MASSRFVTIDAWLGHGAEPLDPARMQFRARLAAEGAGDCAGCIFRGQKAAVCALAAKLAVLADLPDCDERDVKLKRSYVYFVPEQDARQLSIEGLPE